MLPAFFMCHQLVKKGNAKKNPITPHQPTPKGMYLVLTLKGKLEYTPSLGVPWMLPPSNTLAEVWKDLKVLAVGALKPTLESMAIGSCMCRTEVRNEIVSGSIFSRTRTSRGCRFGPRSLAQKLGPLLHLINPPHFLFFCKHVCNCTYHRNFTEKDYYRYHHWVRLWFHFGWALLEV